MENARQEMVKYFNKQIEIAEATVQKFQNGLAENPAYAMEYSDSAFTAAARIRIYGEVVRALENTKVVSVKMVYDYSLDRVKSGALHPQKSTSMASNLYKQEELAAWAKVCEELESNLKNSPEEEKD